MEVEQCEYNSIASCASHSEFTKNTKSESVETHKGLLKWANTFLQYIPLSDTIVDMMISHIYSCQKN